MKYFFVVLEKYFIWTIENGVEKLLVAKIAYG